MKNKFKKGLSGLLTGAIITASTMNGCTSRIIPQEEMARYRNKEEPIYYRQRPKQHPEGPIKYEIKDPNEAIAVLYYAIITIGSLGGFLLPDSNYIDNKPEEETRLYK